VLTPYPAGLVASSRFRIEAFAGPLAAHGIALDLRGHFTARGYRAGRLGRLMALVAGVLGRLRLMLWPPPADLVLVHREAMPGPSAAVEWWLKRVHGLPLALDFDDAMWLRPAGVGRLAHALRIGGKFDRLLGLADMAIAGNAHLAAHARAHAGTVEVIPTVVDAERRFAALHLHRAGPLVIGWTGSHSTVGYLAALAPVLARVAAARPVRLVLIADRFPDLGPGIEVERVAWSEETEVAALIGCDIGLMPLPDDPWTRGKCGFKLVQYMALGIVPVASPVGVNPAIVTEGVDGFLCATPDEWVARLIMLADRPALRAGIGRRARATAEARYSVVAQAPSLAAALRRAAGR